MTWPAGDSLGTQTIVRIRRPPILDGQGNPVLDTLGNATYGDPVETTFAGFSVQPIRSASLDWVGWFLAGPVSTDLVSTDLVRIDGPVTLSIDNAPTVAWDIDGAPDHLQLYAKAWSGRWEPTTDPING